MNISQHHQVTLTGLLDLYANSYNLVDYNEQNNTQNLLDIFFENKDISIVRDKIIQIGGGHYYTRKEFIPNPDLTYDDYHLPGLKSLLEYLDFNFRKKDDDSVTNNTYNISNTYHQNNNNDEHYYKLNKTVNNISKTVNSWLMNEMHNYNVQKHINNKFIKFNNFYDDQINLSKHVKHIKHFHQMNQNDQMYFKINKFRNFIRNDWTVNEMHNYNVQKYINNKFLKVNNFYEDRNIYNNKKIINVWRNQINHYDESYNAYNYKKIFNIKNYQYNIQNDEYNTIKKISQTTNNLYFQNFQDDIYFNRITHKHTKTINMNVEDNTNIFMTKRFNQTVNNNKTYVLNDETTFNTVVKKVNHKVFNFNNFDDEFYICKKITNKKSYNNFNVENYQLQKVNKTFVNNNITSNHRYDQIHKYDYFYYMPIKPDVIINLQNQINALSQRCATLESRLGI